MRLGQVIGRVTLSVSLPSLRGARWLLVNPLSRNQLEYGLEAHGSLSNEPSLVIYDDLGGSVGETIGFVEGREAAQPFGSPTPIDAINAALIDKVNYLPFKK